MSGKRILVPVDLESGSLDGVEFVAGLGVEMPVFATLLSVIHLNVYSVEQRVYAELYLERQQRLRALAKTLFESGSAQVRVRFGQLHEQILAEARDGQNRLIVMPSRETARWWQFTPTTTERIVRDAPCLTLVLPRSWKISPTRSRVSERFGEEAACQPKFSFA